MQKKLLCVGGQESGKWVEYIGKFEVHIDENPLRPHIYDVMVLFNPKSQKNEQFYVYTQLNPERYEFAVEHALNNPI